MGSTGTKALENIGNSGRGRSQGVPKIFRAPICRAHCAVIFAIAQLSYIPDRCRTPPPSTVGDECRGVPGCEEEEVRQRYADST